MKVTKDTYFNDTYTVSEAKNAAALIRLMKDDCTTPKEYADRALRHAHGLRHCFSWDVLKVEAEAAKRPALDWDRMGEGTGLFDVSLTIVAETSHGFVKMWTWLSDIWEISDDTFFDPTVWEYKPVQQ